MKFPLIGKLCHQYGYHPEATGRMVDTAYAVIAPGQAKAPTTPTDIDIFHCTYGHTHKALLKQTVKQKRVSLSGELHERRGCSMAKKGATEAHCQVDGHPSRYGTHLLCGMITHDLHDKCTF